MVPNLSRFLDSDVFDVVAGLDNKRFRIHGELLAIHSETLWWLVSNKLCDGQKRQLVIEEHDGATVGRFAEFLYTGDYQSPSPVKISGTPRKGATNDSLTPPPEIVVPTDGAAQKCETEPESLAEMNANPTSSAPENCETGNTPPLDITPECDELESSASDPVPLPPATFLPEPLQTTLAPKDALETASQQKPPETQSDKEDHFDSAEFDFRDVFLAHGKTYVLAHSFDVKPLERLAVMRLQDVFGKIVPVTPETPVVSNFAELVHYAYKNSTGGSLREALLKFFSPNLKTLRGAELQKLVSNGGDLASDLMQIVCDKLEGSEQENDQEIARADGVLGRNPKRGGTTFHLSMTGKGEIFTRIQQEEVLRCFQQLIGRIDGLVEVERRQKGVWTTRLHAYKVLEEDLKRDKDMLLTENSTIKKEMEKFKAQNIRYRRRLQELGTGIYM
ncbi:unnamed protein product [Tuber aestivum]|uniref:BTB domain-containing protein n=1 Tax=Tuber aestivum TaxID=59557 RepID=A0A292PRR9_9PEZI|nr:unnamed protein product [Tuber aestivum]